MNAPWPGVPARPVKSGFSSAPLLCGDTTCSVKVSEYLAIATELPSGEREPSLGFRAGHHAGAVP